MGQADLSGLGAFHEEPPVRGWQMKKCPSIKPGVLSSRQSNILKEFMDKLEYAQECYGLTFKEIKRLEEESPDEMKKIFIDYQKALFKAIRADLHNYPFGWIRCNRSLLLNWPNDIDNLLYVKAYLKEWLQTHRGLGSKKLLSKAKRGLEVGVKPPLTTMPLT
jgi:hypothetical protein